MRNILIIVIGTLVIMVTLLLLDEYNVIEIIGPPNTHCTDDSKRFPAHGTTGGGKIISKAEALGYIEKFKTERGDRAGDAVFISKKAIDMIWDERRNIEANGIAIYFGLDINDIPTLILDPARANEYQLSGTPSPETIFLTETWCPSVCGNNIGDIP